MRQFQDLANVLEDAAAAIREMIDAYDRAGMKLPHEPDISLADMGLSVRAVRVCDYEGVRTIRQLAAKTEMEVLSWRNCGDTTLAELRAVLNRCGRAFRGGRRLTLKERFDMHRNDENA